MRYFLRIPADRFDFELAPILGECRRRRTFDPIRKLAKGSRNQLWQDTNTKELRFGLPVSQVIHGSAAFSLNSWRFVVGEMLLAAASEVPVLVTPLETFSALIGLPIAVEREQFSPVQQAILGARELAFGGFVYRPQRAGLNYRQDVHWLAQWLQTVDPGRWNTDNLGDGPDSSPDELAYAKEWFPELVRLYSQAAREDCVVVCEDLA